MLTRYTCPQYIENYALWQQIKHCFGGEHVVKAQGDKYLPIPRSMRTEGNLPTSDYELYKARAGYDNFVFMAVQTYLGMLHSKPPVIQLPKKMERLRLDCSAKGESLEQMLVNINREQLLYGRTGLLIDVLSGTRDVLPYVAQYSAERIVNWSTSQVGTTKNKLQFVILNESDNKVAGNYTWQFVQKYRILSLKDAGVYCVKVEENAADDLEVVPSYMSKKLDEVPFIFINSSDTTSDISPPPLLELSNKTLLIYRAEADYRMNLYQQGQDTLVIIGANEIEGELNVGAASALQLPQGAEAKFIGVNSQGLSEQRVALENLRAEAAAMSGQMLDNKAKAKESGDALSMRVGTKTASLVSIARSGAQGMEQALKLIARWIDADESQVSVMPNDDFNNSGMGARDFVDLMTAKSMGAPISNETIHALLKKYNITELAYEEEEKKVLEEEPLLGVTMNNTGTNLNRSGINTPKDPTTFDKGK